MPLVDNAWYIDGSTGITVNDLGTSQVTAGATLTLPSITVPAGALIVVAVNEAIATTDGTLADGSNTYSRAGATTLSTTAGRAAIYYIWNCAALTAATITFTKAASGHATAMSAFYATGIQTSSDPLDATTTATTAVNTATPTVTSGTPTTAGQLIVGFDAWSNVAVRTVSSLGGSFLAPLTTQAASATASITGGHLNVNGTLPVTFAPTLSGASDNATIIVGFKAATSANIGWWGVTRWAASTTKVTGNLIRQNAQPAINSERVFVCIASTSGTGTTGSSEPAYTLTRGAKTTDNTLTWMEATGIAALNGDKTNTPTWTTIKNTAILLGQVIQNVAGTLLLICTTAGTAGNAAEPSWAAFTNAGATTADNTVTWTTLGASFSNWAAPAARLATMYTATWGQAGNSFYVASEHAETQSTGLTIIAPAGNASLITSTYCVNKSNVPPGSANLTTGATISTTGTSALAMSGTNAYFYGLTLNSGTGSTAVAINLGNNGASTYENCTFALVNTGASGLINLEASVQSPTILKNCTASFAAVGQGISGSAGFSIIQNLTLAGSTPTTLIKALSSTIIKGSDLSVVTGTLVGSYGGTIIFQDCKLGGGVTVASGGTQQNGYVDLIRCDSAATNYRNERYRVSGAQTTETTIVRTGGASDGTTPISWKIATSAGSRWVFPFECQPITIWNDTSGSSKTVTIYGISAALPNNDDIWIEVEYPGSSATPLSSFITNTKSDNFATGSALTSDGSTWGGSTTAFRMAVTFTPQMKGPFNILVKAAKVSTTFYIDPLPVVT